MQRDRGYRVIRAGISTGPGVFEDATVEAKLGMIYDIRRHVQVHSRARALRYLGHVFRMDANRTPSPLRRCWVVDGKQPSLAGKTKDLNDSAVHKLLDELGLRLLDAPNKSEWHCGIT